MLDLDEIDDKIRIEIIKNAKKAENKVDHSDEAERCYHGVVGCRLPHNEPVDVDSAAWWMTHMMVTLIVAGGFTCLIYLHC